MFKIFWKLVVPAQEILPLLRIVNLLAPDLEAVKRSPTPDWSMTKDAKDDLAETEAEGLVPWKALVPYAWKLAEVEDVPPMRRSRVVLPL